MFQPTRAQWNVICTVAVLVVGGWPPSTGSSLGLKVVRWAVDPWHTLPQLPAPLPIGLDDDGDAVTAHDLQAASYYDAYQRGGFIGWRMAVKDAAEPLNPTTARQLLVGLVVAGALVVWRLDASRTRAPR